MERRTQDVDERDREKRRRALPLGERYPWGWFSVLAAALVIVVAMLVW
jgi:hypothetical protein